MNDTARRCLLRRGALSLLLRSVFILLPMPSKQSRGDKFAVMKTWAKRLSIGFAIFILIILAFFLVGLRQVLDDLGVRRFRIPAYWTDIEREQGKYDFKILQEQLDEIAKRDGKVMLAIGSRLPRWPECWVPEWATRVDLATRRAVQLAYLQKTYAMFKDHPSVVAFQIENEASFTLYIECDGLTKDLVLEELRYVRGEESKRPNPRPVYTTDSGEFSSWINWAGEVDGLGVRLYRAVTNPWPGV